MKTQEQLAQINDLWTPITPQKLQSESPQPSTKEDEIFKNLGNSNEMLFFDLNFQTPIQFPEISGVDGKNSVFEEQNNTQLNTQLLFSEDNVDLDGLSCLQILGLADSLTTAIADNTQSPSQFQSQVQSQFESQSQFQSATTVSSNYHATPHKEEKVYNEVPITNTINRKRKIGVDNSDQAPKKRKNKYYWAKIDVKKVVTPKPKTPNKAKTPKSKAPPKAKTTKPKAPPKAKSSTKAKSPNNKTPKVKTPKLVRQKGQEHKTKEKPDCKKVLDFEDEDSNIPKEPRQQKLKVYRRTNSFRCPKKSYEIGPNFPNKCKRRRARRNRRLIEEMRSFDGFNYNLIVDNLFDQLIISKGRLSKLVPKKVENMEKFFECVRSILASPLVLRKKRRLTKRLTSANSVVEQSGSLEVAMPIYTTNHEQLTLECNTESIPKDVQNCASEEERLENEAQSIVVIDETKIAKERKPRGTYKRKEKRKDYLSNVNDWKDESLEVIMDNFIQDFEALNLYDDPRKLERWSVMLSEYNDNKGDEDNPNETGENFRLERAILLLKMKRFLDEMTKFQGSKEFVKWNGSVLDSVVGVFLTQNVSDVLSSNAYMELASRFPVKPTSNESGVNCGESELNSSQGSCENNNNGGCQVSYNVEFPDEEEEKTLHEGGGESSLGKEYDAALNDMIASLPDLQGSKGKEKKGEDADSKFDWEAIRVRFLKKNSSDEKDPRTQDSVDWDAVRRAPLKDISDAIKSRGQHWIIAAKIQKVLNRLVEDHGTLDLEWLREAPPQVAKAYLLSFYGLGLKSVECLRLLSLRHHGFPVDVNIGRVAIRLGWVPLKPLPEGLPFHLLQKYPLESEIQQYVWPKLKDVDREFLYQLHYQLITFGKVLCMKKNPNCRACPFKDECIYYKSMVDSVTSKNPYLPWRRSKSSSKKIKSIQNPFNLKKQTSRDLPALPRPSNYSSLNVSLPPLQFHTNSLLPRPNHTTSQQCEPLIEHPESPKKEEDDEKLIENSTKQEEELGDIEDLFKDKDEYILVKLGANLTQTLFDNGVTSSSGIDSCRSLVSLSSEAASIPLPKQINPARLRTEHQVYELPYNHQLLKDLERQQGGIPYLLATWTQEGCSEDCSQQNVSYDCSTVPGTILIPVRTAMRGFFPLNGTYFQVNEVFADYATSQHPINVPRNLIWMLKKRTLYCGTGTSSIMRGLSKEQIKYCCLEGYICTRGFDRQSRSPKSLPTKFHSRLYVKGKLQHDDVEED